MNDSEDSGEVFLIPLRFALQTREIAGREVPFSYAIINGDGRILGPYPKDKVVECMDELPALCTGEGYCVLPAEIIICTEEGPVVLNSGNREAVISKIVKKKKWEEGKITLPTSK